MGPDPFVLSLLNKINLMKKFRVFIKIVLIFVAILFSSQTSFALENHIEHLMLSKDLNEKYSLAGEIDYRTIKNRAPYRHYDFGGDYNLKKDLTIGLRFRMLYLKNKGQWDLSEQRPQLQITKKFESKNVDYELRFRHEYRMFMGGDDKQRERLRFRATSNRKFFNLRPVLFNEIFYDITDNRFNQNRLDVGVLFPTISYFTPSIYIRDEIRFFNADRKWHSDQMVMFRVEAAF